MQFQVPQFIETESKIVGPLTLKQFGYVGVAAAIILILFYVLNFFLWLLIAVVLGAGAGALAFAKINGRPLFTLVSGFVRSVWQPKVYVFRPTIPKRQSVTAAKGPVAEPGTRLTPQRSPLSENQTTAQKKPLFGGIKGLRAWIATSKTAIPRREKPLPRNFGTPQKRLGEKYEVIRHTTGEREVVKRVDYR